MKKILFPTDFSENASLAIPFVLELARKFSSEVYVLHTYQLPYQRSDMFMSVTDIMKKDAEEGVDRVIKELTALPDASGIRFTPVVRVGDVVDACRDLIDEKGFEIVVMGTTGASGLEEVFLGTNAAAVIAGVNIPVLCIPPGTHSTAPKKICLAYDLNEPGLDALKPFISLCKSYGSEVLVLNVAEQGKITSPEEAAEGVQLDHALEGIPHDFFLAEGEDTETAIFNFSKEQKPDWFALVHHRRGFFQRLFSNSLTKKIAYHTNLPLLALHQPKEK